MRDGFIRVCAAPVEVRVGDCAYNAAAAVRAAVHAAEQGVRLCVLPELCLTGYTCGDLLQQQVLLDGARDALHQVAAQTAALDLLLAVGVPLAHRGKLYNCAAILLRGRVLGVVPKSFLPGYGGFSEPRWFVSGADLPADETILLYGEERVPFGSKLLFCCEQMPDFVTAFEICEDLWVPSTPSTGHALAGATVICNLMADPELPGTFPDGAPSRVQLAQSLSARLHAGYLIASAGDGESTTDQVFSGQCVIAEDGALLGVTVPFSGEAAVSELDVGLLMGARRRMNSYPQPDGTGYRRIDYTLPLTETELSRTFQQNPFIPARADELDGFLEQTLQIQTRGLIKRITHTHAQTVVLGISGGLDSALAMLVAVRALDLLGRPRTDLLAVTMPCFGTTARTRSNAEVLVLQMGARLKQIDIKGAVDRHFEDIGLPAGDHGAAFENAQARERTQVLMDLANMQNGFVLGTGDLSELALGWATYNGDQMSMYGINGSIPKTLVRLLVGYEAGRMEDAMLKSALLDILDTPVSPELLPPADGAIAQKTEDLVGPYELHDFFIYNLVRLGFAPRKILRMACATFAGTYTREVIRHWLTTLCRRFFSQQFKRSCMPDGPQATGVSLSPRGGWRMPSDASAALWLSQLDEAH